MMYLIRFITVGNMTVADLKELAYQHSNNIIKKPNDNKAQKRQSIILRVITFFSLV